jgi:hypothetical protein
VAGFKANYRGIGEMLHTPGIASVMASSAAQIATRAAATAPRRTGHYADSFGSRIAVRPTRIVGIAYNNDPAALAIEYGTRDTRAHRTLRRALVEPLR